MLILGIILFGMVIGVAAQFVLGKDAGRTDWTMALGAGLIGSNLAWQIVEEWLATPWGEGRHADRVDKINRIENRYAGGSP